MSSYQNYPPDRDRQLWELAQRRVSFRYHLAAYIVVTGFLWIIWLLSGRHYSNNSWPWPIWPMLGWGIGLVFHYLGAFVFPRNTSVEREYKKLKNQKSNF